MDGSPRGNIGRAIAEHVEGDCVTPVRHELNSSWPAVVAQSLGGRQASGLWLDVGCGTGAGRALLERAGLTGEYVGVDIAPAPGHAPGAGTLRARFVACDIVHVHRAVGEAVADGAVSISAFEHFPDDAAALAAVARALRPGAPLVLCVPSGWGRIVWGPRHGFHWYGPEDLRRLAASSGMALEELRPVGGLASVVLGALWFAPAYILSKAVTAALALRYRGRRSEVRRRHPWTHDLLLRLQFAHCRSARGRRAHGLLVRAVTRLDQRARMPAPAWIAVLRRPPEGGTAHA